MSNKAQLVKAERRRKGCDMAIIGMILLLIFNFSAFMVWALSANSPLF